MNLFKKCHVIILAELNSYKNHQNPNRCRERNGEWDFAWRNQANYKQKSDNPNETEWVLVLNPIETILIIPAI